jgi:hypothetical protein
LVYCYLFLFAYLAVIQAIYIDMVFCKESIRFWWRRVHEDASQGMYMSKIEISFFTARILLFSVHFQEMPGFKRKRGLTLTLYKKPYRYRLPVSPPSKRTKTSDIRTKNFPMWITPGAAPLRWMEPNRNRHWNTSGLRVTLSYLAE